MRGVSRGTPHAVRALGSLLFVALAGCSLVYGDRFEREQREETLASAGPRLDPRALGPQGAPVAASETAAITEPLHLQRALALAGETSERVRAAGESLYQAHMLRIEALSPLLPQAFFHSTYFRQENDFRLPGGGSSPFFLDEQRTSRFQVVQSLFRLGSYLAVAQAASVIQAAEAQLRAERLLVEEATAALFYEALTAERQRDTFDAAAGRDRERLREVQARVASGLARRTEVLFVETDLARTQAALADATERVASSRERLGLLVGRPVRGALVEPVPPAAETPGLLAARPLGGLIERAFAERPDLQALQQQIEIQEGGRLVALGAYAPTLDLTANGYTHRDGTSKDVDWDVSVDLVVPLFEGLLTSARVREAESRKRQAELLFRAQGRAIAADVASAYHALRAAGSARVSQAEALRSAEENFRLLEAEYGVGLSTNIELVTAQQELTAARLAFETVRLDEQRLAVELRFLVGEDALVRGTAVAR